MSKYQLFGHLLDEERSADHESREFSFDLPKDLVDWIDAGGKVEHMTPITMVQHDPDFESYRPARRIKVYDNVKPVVDIDDLRAKTHAIDKALMAVECFDHPNLDRLSQQRKRIEENDYHEAVIERVEAEIRAEYIEGHGNTEPCFLCMERDTKSWQEFATIVDDIRDDDYDWHGRDKFCKPCQTLTHANDPRVGKIGEEVLNG